MPARPVKLLHLSNYYPPFATGAVERQCRLVVNELAHRGHLSRVLTSHHGHAEVTDREPAAQRVLKLGATPEIGRFERLWLNERHNHAALRAELDQLNPDVAIVWGMAGLSNGLLWELVARAVPTVFAVLDPWPRFRLRDDPWYQWWTTTLPVGQRLIRRAVRAIGLDRRLLQQFPVRRPTELRLPHAFFASRALRDKIRAAGYEIGESEIIPYCLGREDLPPAPPRREEMRRLLWIGRLDAERDPMTALRAIQELRHEGHMRFSLDLYGRGEAAFENRLNDYVRDTQLAGAVNIRHVGAEDLTGLFPSYDIFLFTARHPEPFPHVLLRAMAARLPIVCTTEGSTHEVIENGVNAISFRTGDPVDCAARIAELAHSRELADQIAERAYREALDNYSALVVAGRVERMLLALARDSDGAN